MFPKRYSTMRLVIYVTLVIVFILAVSLFHDTYNKLNDAKGNAEKCTQLQESLSAQLQVVFEHKTRLEKSLHEEKANYKRSEEELQAYKAEAESNLDKEKQQANQRYTSLKQDYDILKNQQSDLQAELDHLRLENTKILEDKQKLFSQTNLELAKVREEKDTEIFHLQGELKQADILKEKLQMGLDNTMIKLRSTEQQLNPVVAEVQYLRYKYQEAQSEVEENKKIINQLKQQLLYENKQMKEKNIDDDERLRRDTEKRQQHENNSFKETNEQKQLAGSDIRQLSNDLRPNFQQQKSYNRQIVDQFQQEFAQNSQRKIDHMNGHFNNNNNKQVDGRIHFAPQGQQIQREFNQDSHNLVQQPVDHPNQNAPPQMPFISSKQKNIFPKVEQPDLNNFNLFEAKPKPESFHLNREINNIDDMKSKLNPEFKPIVKQVPRPHLNEKEVQRLPQNMIEKSVLEQEADAQVGKPDLKQDSDNLGQIEKKKANVDVQMAKPLLHQSQDSLPNIAVPHLAGKDEKPLFQPMKKDEDIDAVGNDAGDTLDKDEYKDQDDERNIDENEEKVANERGDM